MSLEVVTFQGGEPRRIFDGDLLIGVSFSDLKFVYWEDQSRIKGIVIEWAVVDTTGEGSVIYKSSYLEWNPNEQRLVVVE